MTGDCNPNFDIWYSSGQGHKGGKRAYLVGLFVYFEKVGEALGPGLEGDGLWRTEKGEEGRVCYALYERGMLGKDADYQRLVIARGPPDADLCDVSLSTSRSRSLLFKLTRLKEAHTQPQTLPPPSASSTATTLHPLCSSTSIATATVISANRFIGFGPTGTQEEANVGSTPTACPAVLLTPPLGDSEVLVVTGVDPVVSIKGYGRDARLDRALDTDKAGSGSRSGSTTFLFMDALELDWYDNSTMVPDLLPGNVDRELHKAFTAFSAFRLYHWPPTGPLESTTSTPTATTAKQTTKPRRTSLPSTKYSQAKASTAPSHTSTSISTGTEVPVVRTGLWGCRSFGGNREIKAVIQLCAAALAGVELEFVLTTSSPDDEEFGNMLEEFVSQAGEEGWRVRDVLDVLKELGPESPRAREVFKYVKERMRERHEAIVDTDDHDDVVASMPPLQSKAFGAGTTLQLAGSDPVSGSGGRRRSSIRELFGRRRKSIV
jgi:hypothetical protein